MLSSRSVPISDDEPAGASRLLVDVPAGVAAERATQVLGPERAAWLGEEMEVIDGAARHLLNLELRVSDLAPRVTFHKAASVEVGPLHEGLGGGPPWVEISWRAAGMAPLFPVFAGRLTWQDGELLLDGYYAPPGGAIGQMADRLLLNVAARATARRLLERIAEAMGPATDVA